MPISETTFNRRRLEEDALAFVARELDRDPTGAPLGRETWLVESGRVAPEDLPRLAAFVQLRTGLRPPPELLKPRVFRSIAEIGNGWGKAGGQDVRVHRRDSRAGSLDGAPTSALPLGRGLWAARGEAARTIDAVDRGILARVRRQGGEAIEGTFGPTRSPCHAAADLLAGGSVRRVAFRGRVRGGPPPFRPLERHRCALTRHVAATGDPRAFLWGWIRETQNLAAHHGTAIHWREGDGRVLAAGHGPSGRAVVLAELHTHEEGPSCAVFFLERWAGAVVAVAKSGVRAREAMES